MTHAHDEDENDLERIAAARPNMKFATMPVNPHSLDAKGAIVAAMKQSFQDIVAGSANKLFEDTGVTMPGDHVWERYAQAALSALPSQEAEAVAWRWRHKTETSWESWSWLKVRPTWLEGDGREGFVVESLYTHPAPTVAPGAVSVKALQWQSAGQGVAYASGYKISSGLGYCHLTLHDGWVPISLGQYADSGAAETAAQSDYEARIRSAIIPAKPAGVVDLCASEGCGKPAAVHFIRGDVGSYYCQDCYLRIHAGETERLAALQGATDGVGL